MHAGRPSRRLEQANVCNEILATRTMKMTELPDEAALALEFDVLAKRAGLDIPADRRPALFAGFKDLRRMTTLMRQPRTAADEPAGTFSILSVTRGL
jgi:hypothetical protein